MRGSQLLRGTLAPFFVLVLVLGLVPAALAAGTMSVDPLNLSIMPEYDAMNVIAVASGTFQNDTGGPFQDKLVWLMPKGSEVFMLCETENGMSCQAYNLDDSDPNYTQVIWRPSRAIQPGEKFPVMFEYTTNKFTAPGERKFAVPFQATFPVKNLTVEFKQPKNATNLVLNPETSQRSQDSEGFTNFYYRYDQLQPMDKLNFAVSYTRNETKPSKAPLKQEGGAAGATGGVKNNTIAIGLLAGFAVILGLVMFYAMRGAGDKPTYGKSGGRKGTARPQAATTVPVAKSVPAKAGRGAAAQEEKKRIRKLLLDGKISEETYRQMIADIEDEE